MQIQTVQEVHQCGSIKDVKCMGMAEKSRVVQKTSVAPEKKRPFSQVKNFNENVSQ